MKTEFGILVAQGFGALSDGARLLFQEIALDSGETLKLTDPAEMVKGARVNSRVKIVELFARRTMTILDTDQDRIDAGDYQYGSANDPMLALLDYPF